MGLLDRLNRALGGSGPSDDDPDEFVELTRVPSFAGPMTAARLEAAGISVVAEDSFDIVRKSLSEVRLLVARRDLARAEAVLARADDDSAD